MSDNVDISLVVPVFNEQDSIAELYAEATAVLSGLTEKYEIIFVDDGSTDNTPVEINQVAAESSMVRHVVFSSNSGKSSASTVGFELAWGKYCGYP